MFGFQHFPELFIVLIVALIFLGPKRLPEVGKSLGQAIQGFKSETQNMREQVSSVTDTVHSTVHDAASPVSDRTDEKP